MSLIGKDTTSIDRVTLIVTEKQRDTSYSEFLIGDRQGRGLKRFQPRFKEISKCFQDRFSSKQSGVQE